jgi:hypothetical protein
MSGGGGGSDAVLRGPIVVVCGCVAVCFVLVKHPLQGGDVVFQL